MLELALHILDIAENSVRAGAKTVFIDINESRKNDRLSIEIRDDGSGMDEATVKRAMDPFYTSKKVRRVGLGLPMLAEAAERAGGLFAIESREGVGTRVAVEFRLSHIDRQPLGDVTGSILALIAGNAGVDFVYRHDCDGSLFTLDTREIRSEIGDIPINHVEVLKFVRQHLVEGLNEIGTEARSSHHFEGG
ncbi:MAG: sensor histidine kinase [Deltaproteobacteria bacterium]|nr:sensor histidine kinase [Deltaproteobacteria bacterium]